MSLELVYGDGEEATVRKVLEFLRGMHEEVGQAPLNDLKAMREIYRVSKEGALLIVQNGDDIAASCGLVQGEYWYTDAPFMTNRWFYVHPDRRAAGTAFRMLVREVQAIVNDSGVIANIDFLVKKRGAGALELQREAERYTLAPRGTVVSFKPRAA